MTILSTMSGSAVASPLSRRATDVDFGKCKFLPPSRTEASSIGIPFLFDPGHRYSGNPIAPFFAELLLLHDLHANWNSYGAPPPNERALSRAREMLHLLHDENLSPSSLGPSADGGVAISFFDDEKIGMFEFFNTGEIVYAFSSGPQQTTVEELESTELKSAIEALRGQLRG